MSQKTIPKYGEVGEWERMKASWRAVLVMVVVIFVLMIGHTAALAASGDEPGSDTFFTEKLEQIKTMRSDLYDFFGETTKLLSDAGIFRSSSNEEYSEKVDDFTERLTERFAKEFVELLNGIKIPLIFDDVDSVFDSNRWLYMNEAVLHLRQAYFSMHSISHSMRRLRRLSTDDEYLGMLNTIAGLQQREILNELNLATLNLKLAIEF